ncbi:hypothetical protein AAVH_11553 [Aphelenchoides avenae]|nr:hypothetical protein AAVH_11553 [Aphelenchus avenae]
MVPEIVKSQHFFMLMSQFYCLDDCRCDCVFGRAVEIHVLHRQVLDKRSELAEAEDKLREAESDLF